MEIEIKIPDGHELVGVRTEGDRVIIIIDRPRRPIGYRMPEDKK